MKKKLEAELISIAHRILKIHNREDIAQLQQEALNLYQKLSILRFYEEHFEPAKPTIGRVELEVAIDKIEVPEIFDKQPIENSEVLNEIENQFVNETETKFTENVILEPASTPNESPTISIPEELEVVDLNIPTETTVELQEDVLVNIEPPVSDVIVEFTEESIEDKSVISEFSDITIIENITETADEIVTTELKTETIEYPETELEIIEQEAETVTTELELETETIEYPETELEIDSNIKNEEVEKEVANPLFNEEHPTLMEQFKPKQTETTLFADNLFAEIDESFAPKPTNSIQSSFENLFGQTYKDLEFVKATETPEEDIEKPKAKRESKKSKQTVETEDTGLFGAKLVADMYTNTITLGLNDRIAFQIHLFNNSDQDLNRVVSQLNTMNNLDEALDFITNMVKPDYNNWKHKEEYEDRFMALVEKRFS